MKHSSWPESLKMLLAVLLFNSLHLALRAQDSSSSTTTTTTSTSSNSRIDMSQSGEWYTSPWVWVAGAAVFILLLIALLRGGGNNRKGNAHTEQVTVTKTVREDDANDTV